jgi:hypothetical protein
VKQGEGEMNLNAQKNDVQQEKFQQCRT